MRGTIDEKIETETPDPLRARVTAIRERPINLEVERALLLARLGRRARLAPAWFQELL
jgi:hypothetical protein